MSIAKQAPIRWGILGTGNIATSFCKGLVTLPDAKLTAIGSRSLDTANEFADRFGAPNRHASYAALAQDPEVDVIYIATPHTLHLENTLLCLEAGKAVLCEKPFTINAAQARQAIDAARSRGLFLMDAIWSRFFPMMDGLRALLAEGAIGEVRMVSADFGFRTSFAPEKRIFNPELGGGALLDVGVYPISLASMILGKPDRSVSLADLGQTGVDEGAAMVLGYRGGRLAVLHTATRTRTPHDAVLMGTEGFIRLHSPWWIPQSFTVDRPGQEPQRHDFPFTANGYNYEAAEVQRCLRAGLTESPIMPLDETLAIMETMDDLRAQWGLRYPME
jgi:predicted dehydrogenase